MSDTYLNIAGKLIKLIDLGDGTFALAAEMSTDTEGSFHAAAPIKGSAIGGVFSVADPTYNNGDLTTVRTNAKGEIIVEANISPTVEPVATDFETLAITNAVAVALTEAKIANKVKAMITVETAEIRWRIDGTAPTTAVGHIGAKGDIIMLTNATDISHFSAIATSATSAALSITYFA